MIFFEESVWGPRQGSGKGFGARGWRKRVCGRRQGGTIPRVAGKKKKKKRVKETPEGRGILIISRAK